MGVTRLFVTADKDVADETAGFWKTHPDGYTVHGIGPTAKIKVQKAEDGSTLWESPGSAPCYGVLATRVDAAAAPRTGTAATAAPVGESDASDNDE